MVAHKDARVNAILSAGLPALGTFVGAGITYVTNVRTRKRTKEEEIYHDALGAMAQFIGAKVFMWRVGTADNPMTVEEQRDLAANLAEDGLTKYAEAQGRARAALARASAYDGSLLGYLEIDSETFAASGGEIIGRLRAKLR